MKKSHWNYRIIRMEDDGDTPAFGLFETYYTNGTPDSWMEKPIVVGDSPEEIVKILTMMIADAKKDIATGGVLRIAENGGLESGG